MNYKELIYVCIGVIINNDYQITCEQVNCSRRDSAIVRKFIDEKIISAYERLKTSIPEKCLWNKNHDIFDKQNRMIQKLADENWQCGFCGKEFYTESYLWQHFDQKHHDQLFKGPDSVCLADLCPLVRCDIINSLYSKQPTTNWAQKLCNREHMLALKTQSITMIDHCLESDSTNFQILRDYLLSVITEFLSCEKYWNRSARSQGGWLSINVYLGVIVFVVGLVVYYIALFVRLNKIDSGLSGDNSPDVYPMRRYPQHNGKYHGVDLTYRGRREVS